MIYMDLSMNKFWFSVALLNSQRVDDWLILGQLQLACDIPKGQSKNWPAVINHGLPRRRLGCAFLIVDFPVNKHLVHLSCIIFHVFSLKLWYWNLHLIILGDPLRNRHTALRGVKRSGRVKLGWHLVILLIFFHFCWSLIMFKNLGIPETGTRRSFQPYKVSARPVIGCFLKPSNCSCVHLSTPKSFRTQSTEKTVKLVVNHRLAAYIWVYGVSLSIHHQPR